jgi:hypothetical protein
MGLGVEDLRWMIPVRPGDVLHVEGELAELIPSRTKPQGIAKVKWTAYNLRLALLAALFSAISFKAEASSAQAAMLSRSAYTIHRPLRRTSKASSCRAKVASANLRLCNSSTRGSRSMVCRAPGKMGNSASSAHQFDNIVTAQLRNETR